LRPPGPRPTWRYISDSTLRCNDGTDRLRRPPTEPAADLAIDAAPAVLVGLRRVRDNQNPRARPTTMAMIWITGLR
jgi:hypothetical protein